jgi:hypothetical protein
MPCNLRTYWTAGPNRELVGISVEFGSVKRVFGRAEGTEDCTYVSAGNWIKEIGLLFSRFDSNRNHDGRRIGEYVHMQDSVINGITVSSSYILLMLRTKTTHAASC